jgi:hypothetical protein
VIWSVLNSPRVSSLLSTLPDYDEELFVSFAMSNDCPCFGDYEIIGFSWTSLIVI